MDNIIYRKLGIDYGDARVGIAITDALRPYSTRLRNYTSQ